MIWRKNGAPKCPRCGGKMMAFMEAENVDGAKRVRYVLRCKSCGYRNVLQDITLRKSPQGVFVSIMRHRF